MSPEDDPDEHHALATEKVIRALEALAAECQANGLPALGTSISVFALKCQTDYVTSRRKTYAAGKRKPKASGSTTH